MNLTIPSPVQSLNLPEAHGRNIQVWIKRDDLIHPEISGNKWRKLKYHLQEAQQQNRPILTFGGAYSNHLAATAAAGHLSGIKTIALVRGERISPLNPTLQFAEDHGMELHFISREQYRQKNSTEFLDQVRDQFGSVHLVPEGGYSVQGMQGCAELVNEIEEPFDYILTASGTGTTLAGIASALSKNQQAIGVPVLKSGEFITNEVAALWKIFETKPTIPELWTDFHFGGYARITDDLVAFANSFYREHHIPLDLVYTAKLFFGLIQRLETDYFPEGSSIVVVHTGGLQGNAGMKQRHGVLLEY
ncbi:1-aminocyclopropane-1-carboxylate deaminase/D-cysteine desulfhydrase [bacterium SCSIO 12741]|nr:1-aminocyclopropane-1-carboxylate deaminase/D-cysteine desulfhydrase [bacterium SCSIO 12741]